MSDLVCRHLVIHGRVQGVFFRDSMAREARRLGITGWVRNRLNGTVEAEVQGTAESVAQIIRWAQRGPELARVAQVEVFDGTGDYRHFVQRDTA